MKNLQFIFILLFSLTISAQKTNKTILADKLMTTIDVKGTTQTIISKVIEQFKTKKTNVPSTVWQEIEKSINYTDYLENVKQAYISTYTEKEIEELIKLYNPKTIDQYTSKSKKIETKLYSIGNDFGKNVVKIISERIKQYN